jgi:predicted dehydrogenase
VTPTATTGVAVVGAGYWGIHHVRVFAAEPRCSVRWVCDTDPTTAERGSRVAGAARATSSVDQVLADPEVEAVVIATPSPTHAALACRALDAGKHVLVEKPMATSVADGERVVAAARRSGRVVLVGHLMVFHPALVRLGEIVASGALGELFYLHSTRVNLGRLRRDENALWSFAPHDLSMIDRLIGQTPRSVTARGQGYLQPGVEDVVFVTLRFAGGQMAHVHLSWLDPRKERRLTLVGSQKMAEFDDVAAEKLRIYDKGYDRPPTFGGFEEYLTLRQGDVHIPHVTMEEPLRIEARHFLDCIQLGTPPHADAHSGLRVVRVLDAAQRSLELDGIPVAFEDPGPTNPGSPGPFGPMP